jgi:hypothetical protein
MTISFKTFVMPELAYNAVLQAFGECGDRSSDPRYFTRTWRPTTTQSMRRASPWVQIIHTRHLYGLPACRRDHAN